MSEEQLVKLTREDVECNLKFLGLLVFVNQMKE